MTVTCSEGPGLLNPAVHAKLASSQGAWLGWAVSRHFAPGVAAATVRACPAPGVGCLHLLATTAAAGVHAVRPPRPATALPPRASSGGACGHTE